MRKRYLGFAIIPIMIGYHAVKRQITRQDASPERKLQQSPVHSAEDLAETKIHLPPKKTIAIEKTEKAPAEEPVLENAIEEELNHHLTSDPEIQAVADIWWLTCDGFYCQISVESKTDNLSRFKRTFITFLKQHPEHGPYWKFVSADDYDRALRVVFSNKPI